MLEKQKQPTNQPLKRIEKPWGYEILWAATDTYVGKILFVMAGHQLSLQFHREKEETMFLEAGECYIETGPDAENLVRHHCVAGSIFHIPVGTLHRVIAIKDCRMFEVSTPQLNDVVRLEDSYGRV